ncbi:MAG: hypothetical protein VKJ24_18885, partial [Synechococcales bacterium]|nr:hypothetical protein [Synechococcales bacterium]
MTIAFSSQLIQVSLTPMQLPEGRSNATAQAAWGGSVVQESQERQRLRLTPGECSQLLVQIRNLSRDRHLSMRLQLVGNFPAHWVQPLHQAPIILSSVVSSQPSSQPSSQQSSQQSFPTSHVEQLNFNLTDWPPETVTDLQEGDRPSQFFEHPTALQPQETLAIDYRAQLLIYGFPIQNEGESTAEPRSPANPDAEKLIGVVEFDLLVRPRSLYLDFLPAIYREVDFIGRLLKIFEQGFEPAVDSWQMLWAYLDPHTAPTALLPFLAHWVGWPGQVPWDERQQRQLIRRA